MVRQADISIGVPEAALILFIRVYMGDSLPA